MPIRLKLAASVVVVIIRPGTKVDLARKHIRGKGLNEHLVRQALVKDLDWVLACPTVFAPHPQIWQPDPTDFNVSHSVDAHFDALSAARAGKLGHYFETMAFALFSESPAWQILARNHVLSVDKRTLGELDLLLRNTKDGCVLHLELALKFYLWAGNQQTTNDGWIGAGLHDFLSRKARRLFSHQLALFDIANTQNAWPPTLPKPDAAAAWIPGRLFVPDGDTLTNMPSEFAGTPWVLNPAAHTSFWYEIDALEPSENRALAKGEWLRGESMADIQRPLPAQFSLKTATEPVYVVPKGWHTAAQTAIEHYVNAQ